MTGIQRVAMGSLGQPMATQRTMEFACCVAAIPVGKARPRVVRHNGKIRTYTPAKTVAFEQLLGWALKSQLPRGFAPVTCPVELFITAALPIPKSWAKAKREAAAAGIQHATVKPDIDNLGKACLDAFNGVLYADDAQVTTLTITKVYSKEPHVKVRAICRLQSST